MALDRIPRLFKRQLKPRAQDLPVRGFFTFTAWDVELPMMADTIKHAESGRIWMSMLPPNEPTGQLSARNHDHLMKIDFDPSDLDMVMQLWRNALDMKIPVHDNFKIHFLEERGSILKNYESAANAWSMALRAMKPSPEDFAELAALSSRVGEFGDWAKEEQRKLLAMEISESIQDGISELLNDPGTRDQVMRLLDQMRRKGNDSAG